MCGIVGAVAQRDIAEILLEGLRRLEYRGYDSAGLAVVDAEGHMTRLRRLGKVQMLAQAAEEHPLHGVQHGLELGSDCLLQLCIFCSAVTDHRQGLGLQYLVPHMGWARDEQLFVQL